METNCRAHALALLLLLAACPPWVGVSGATDITDISPLGETALDATGGFQTFGRGLTPFDAAVAPDGRVVVVGRGGLMAVLASDGQQVAGRIKGAGKNNLLSVALGPDGLLRVTDADGTIWRIDAALGAAAPEGKSDSGGLFSVQFTADGMGVAVGESGTVLLKQSGSSQWQPLAVSWSERLPDLALEVGDLAPHLYRVCPRPGGGFLAVGEFGVTLTYRNGEVDVQRAAQDAGNLFACHSEPDGRDIVAGRSGTFFGRTSPGTAWLETRAIGAADIYDIVSLGSSFVAVGQGGGVTRSSDGLNWASVSRALSPGTEWLVRVIPIGQGLLLVGKDGYFFIRHLRELSASNYLQPILVSRITERTQAQ